MIIDVDNKAHIYVDRFLGQKTSSIPKFFYQ